MAEVSEEEIVKEMVTKRNKGIIVNYLNIHAFNLATIRKDFREALNSCDILFCDGFGIKLTSKILNSKIGKRMTPPDWVDQLFGEGVKHERSFYFIGDEPHVIQRFIETVSTKYPNIDISGYHHGFFLDNEEVENELLEDLEKKRPDILLIGMGMPRQELWAIKASGVTGNTNMITVGALFRYISGVDKRSGKWITNSGFEWLDRLIRRPRKTYLRYLLGIPFYVFNITWRLIRNMFVRKDLKETTSSSQTN